MKITKNGLITSEENDLKMVLFQLIKNFYFIINGSKY